MTVSFVVFKMEGRPFDKVGSLFFLDVIKLFLLIGGKEDIIFLIT